jgi:hypothetical protein
MSEPLPELLDVKALRAELGVTRAAAEAIMRRLPVVQLPGAKEGLRSPLRRGVAARGVDVHEGSGADVSSCPGSVPGVGCGNASLHRRRFSALLYVRAALGRGSAVPLPEGLCG